MKVKIKKLHPNAVIPTYSKKGDAGMDLTITDTTNIGEAFTGFFEFRTGIAVEIPEGYVGLVFPRSSISKTPFVLANSVGVIDSGYRGEVIVMLTNLTHDPIRFERGKKIAQLIIQPHATVTLEQAAELSETERGENAFGSTGE
jgi:dUTP pyrophosphatase